MVSPINISPSPRKNDDLLNQGGFHFFSLVVAARPILPKAIRAGLLAGVKGGSQ